MAKHKIQCLLNIAVELAAPTECLFINARVKQLYTQSCTYITADQCPLIQQRLLYYQQRAN